MSQISSRAAAAFLSSAPFRSRNTRVLVRNGTVHLFLFGVLIAIRHVNVPGVYMSLRGYQTRTTFNRLNAVLDALSAGRLVTRRGYVRTASNRIECGFRVWGFSRGPTAWYYADEDIAVMPASVLPTLPFEAIGPLNPDGNTAELAVIISGRRLPRLIDITRVTSNRPPPGIRKANVIPLPLP